MSRWREAWRMWVDDVLVGVLACPETRQRLHPADAATVVLLNGAIGGGGLRNRSGRAVTEPVEGALVRADGAVCYLIRGGVPLMLADEAVALPVR